MEIRSSHNRFLFDLKTQKQFVSRAVKILKPFSHEFDFIAISGFSGALLAPIVADKLKKQIVLVRKDGDSSHSAYLQVEGPTVGRYIIFDDFIASGNTVRYIKKTITNIKDINLEFVGLYMYRGPHCWSVTSIESTFGKLYGDKEYNS